MDFAGIAHVVLLTAEVVVGFFVLYLCLVAAAAARATLAHAGRVERTGLDVGQVAPRFAIIIPAHNEESTLGVLLDCLNALSYPRELFTVCVIADNCADQTADIARARDGVRVFERRDEARRGKGYALRWALERIEAERLPYDVCLVLDADAVVAPDVLSAFARALAGGAQAVQGRYLARNPQASASAALRWVALALANYVRPLGRYTLGASASITGNGFCLTRELLQSHPWSAFGLAEDYQYYLSLVESGVRVNFASDALIYSDMPTTFRQMHTQDVRWESLGAGQTPARVIAWRLLRTWLRTGDMLRLEALIELLTPQLSLLCLSSSLLVIAAAALRDVSALLGATALVAGICMYVCSVFLLHPPTAVYRALIFAPWYAARKVWIILVVSRRARETSAWVRTSREI